MLMFDFVCAAHTTLPVLPPANDSLLFCAFCERNLTNAEVEDNYGNDLYKLCARCGDLNRGPKYFRALN